MSVETESEGRRALDEARRLLRMAEEFAGIGRWSVEVPSLKLAGSPHVFRIYGLEVASDAPDVATAIAAYHPDDREKVRTPCLSEGKEDLTALHRLVDKVRAKLVRAV